MPTLEELFRAACRAGTNPVEFWNMTLQENVLIMEATRERDADHWNHTASLMALYANSKSAKGKRFSPEDFHPTSIMQKEERKPKSKDDIENLINKHKSFNG